MNRRPRAPLHCARHTSRPRRAISRPRPGQRDQQDAGDFSFSAHEIQDLRLDRHVQRGRLSAIALRSRQAPSRSSRADACRRKAGAVLRRRGARARITPPGAHFRSRATAGAYAGRGAAPALRRSGPTVSTGLSEVIGPGTPSRSRCRECPAWRLRPAREDSCSGKEACRQQFVPAARR